MAAVKSTWFIKNFDSFINASFKLFGENINQGAIPKEIIKDLKDELLCDEIKTHMRVSIENKSIRENADMDILGHEMKLATAQITKDRFYKNSGNNHIPPLLAGKDDRGMARLSEL